MKKHIVKVHRMKGIIAKLMVVMLIVVTVASRAASPPVVHATTSLDPLAGEKYFADVGKDYYKYEAIKYCNERNVFGRKKGKNFHMHPLAEINQGQFITYIYNMYHEKIDWGNKSYSKKAKKSWQWAQSNGYIYQRNLISHHDFH